MVACFAAGIILVRKLKKKSLYWQAGIPLCIILGIIAISLVIFTFYEPSNPALRPLGNALTVEMIGYALLPAAAVYFLRFWKNTFGNISDASFTVYLVIGAIGGIFLLYLLCSAITFVLSQTPQHYDVFQFSLGSLIVLLCAFFYGAILLPLIGWVFLKLGFACRTPPKEPENNSVTAP